MSEENAELKGPDLCQGVPAAMVTEATPLLGYADGEPTVLVRCGNEYFAIGAVCTHYGAPLAEGLVVDDTLRCPWHHACFSLRNGEALRAPALSAVACRTVELRNGLVCVGERIEPAATAATPGVKALSSPRSIIIIGGGAAGDAAAEMLRREHYDGPITMLSADDSLPCDRPNLSKNYLAGTAQEQWIPLRTMEFYRQHNIDLRLNTRVTRIDTAKQEVLLEDGRRQAFGALLLATGATPRRLTLTGADRPHVHYLRTLADSRALVAAATKARCAVVIGAGFIGLEVAASLRAREIGVHVVGRDAVPMENILGAEVGGFLRAEHEQHGVTFHMCSEVASISERAVTLGNGETLDADLVIIGIGAEPVLGLAEQAGLTIDRGVKVDRYLATSTPGIYAAGDIARWPDRHSGDSIRVEHWVVAQRQGQVAARNMLGRRESFEMVPFFWTEQYDFAVAYVGHAERFDEVEIDGTLAARDCRLTYRRAGRRLAVAVINRDLEGLRCEVEFERALAAGA